MFFSAGSNDPDLMSPTLMSRRVPFTGGVNQPYGLCEFGHQGLYHDEELSLIYNRARHLHPTLGRFMQRDPLGYADGMNVYAYTSQSPVNRVDPRGLVPKNLPTKWIGSSSGGTSTTTATPTYSVAHCWMK